MSISFNTVKILSVNVKNDFELNCATDVILLTFNNKDHNSVVPNRLKQYNFG